VTDRLMLNNMVFRGRHGMDPAELDVDQPFEVDVEMALDLRPAGEMDDLARTIDYRDVFEIARSVIEGPSRDLIEALAEAIAGRVLELGAQVAIAEVTVRVRKPDAPLPGQLDHAAVEIVRRPL
jgi:dihydroneopterin aldolase